MTRCLLLAFSLFVHLSLFSQKIQLVNSGDAITKGIAAYDSGNYEAAIKTFLTVSPRDTNYVWMQAELAQAYNGAKEYDKAIALVDEAVRVTSPNKAMLLKTKAIALDKKGEYDKSVKLFEQLLEKYPTDQNLVFNLGITHYNNGSIEKAKDCFFRSLSINPYHKGSHVNLGVISLNEGRKVHAMLSYGLYIVLNEHDNARLVMLNKLVANEIEDEGSTAATGPNAFEKLDQIIRAKLAMDKNFKSSIPVDAAVVKQFEMLFEQIDLYDKDMTDPWAQFYIPIFKGIKDQKMVVPFIYHMISSANNDKVKSWHKKNQKELKNFYGIANTHIRNRRGNPILCEQAGFEKGISGWYNDDGKLIGLGARNADGKNLGRWVWFHTNGERSAEGVYGTDGKKKGTWKYFSSSGIMTSEENEDTGETTTYYSTGEKREHYFTKDGKTQGVVDIYFPCGNLKERLTYRDGKIDGEGTQYFANGNKRSVYNYKDGKLDGEYTSYYEHGTLRSKYMNRGGDANGLYEEFHPNGKLAKSGHYKDDEQEGQWKYYYVNGQLSRTGSYVKGLGQGEWVYYNERGELIEKRNLKDGKIEGENSFYHKGKLHYLYQYDKDKLVRVAYFGPDGKTYGDFGNKNGTFSAKAFYVTGEQKSEGKLVNGELDGEWKYFYRHGKLSSKVNYVKGIQQGEAVDYYHSGAIKSKSTYLDGELHGYYQEFYEHGPVKSEGWYQNGKRQQTFLSYTSDGKVESDYFYLNDELSGEAHDYHQGKPLSTVVYNNGLVDDLRNFGRKGTSNTIARVDGPKKTFETKFGNKPVQARFEMLCGEYSGPLGRWYADGKEYYSYPMVGGRRHGPYKYYGLENNLETTGQYLYGQLDGLWKGYNEEGKLDHIGRFLDNDYDSVWTYYYLNGKISQTAEYFHDKRDGLTTLYAPDGSPAIEKMFEQGDLISFRAKTAQGEWTDWQKAVGNATILAYYPGGKKSFEEQYADNYLTGVRKIYYPDGKVYSQFEYKNGDNEGPFVVYYENGKMQRQGQYENDELTGVMKFYNSDGTLKRTEEYVNGARSGKVVFYKKGVKSKEYAFWGGLPDE